MMTSAQVVETSVNITSNSPSQDYTHPDDHNLPNYDKTPGFKPFTTYYEQLTWSEKGKILKSVLPPVITENSSLSLVSLLIKAVQLFYYFIDRYILMICN